MCHDDRKHFNSRDDEATIINRHRVIKGVRCHAVGPPKATHNHQFNLKMNGHQWSTWSTGEERKGHPELELLRSGFSSLSRVVTPQNANKWRRP